ncbi:MAG: hypothetical protein V7K40_20045 [Nostoc sp.]
MPNERLCLKTSGTAMKEHFQPEALNEVIKEFLLKLTRMSSAPTGVPHVNENRYISLLTILFLKPYLAQLHKKLVRTYAKMTEKLNLSNRQDAKNTIAQRLVEKNS